MKCYYTAAPSRKKQQGLGLATAIFVITVMAVIAVVISQLVVNNAETTQEEIELIRAFYSAESGIQFGMNTLFPPDGSSGSCPAGPENYDLQEGGLSACEADVYCESVTVSSVNYYTITSTGTCNDVNRTIQVRAQ